MAMDFDRLKNSIVSGLTTDPDSQYPPGAAIPDDGPELNAFAYYFAQAIIEEIVTKGEVDTTTGEIS